MKTFIKMSVVFTSVFLTGCSAHKAGLGQIVKKNVVCIEGESCKSSIAKDCPKGAQLHGIIPAIVVQYSCNSD
jgi:hypothetical protein